MPLEQFSSKAALGENIKREEAAGKPAKQAEAIAFSTQRANDEDPEGSEPPTPADINAKNKAFWDRK